MKSNSRTTYLVWVGRVFLLVLALDAGPVSARVKDSDLQKIENAIEAAPTDAQAYRALFDHAEGNRDFPQVIVWLRDFVARRPDNSLAQYTLGLSYHAVGEKDAAIAAWEAALALSPGSRGPAYVLTSTYLADRKLLDAVRVLGGHAREVTAQSRPPSPEIFALMIAVLQTVATDDSSLDPATQAATLDIVRQIVAVVYLATAPMVTPDRVAYQNVRIPGGNAIVPAERLSERLHDVDDVIDLYTELGVFASRQAHYDDRGRYFEEAFQLAKKKQRTVHYLSSGGNLAHHYDEVGRSRDAYNLFSEMIDYGEKLLRDQQVDSVRIYTANNYYNASNTAWRLGRIADSLQNLYRAERLYHADLPKLGSDQNNYIFTYEKLIARELFLSNLPEAKAELRRLQDVTSSETLTLNPGLQLSAFRVAAQIALAEDDLGSARRQIGKAQDFQATASPFLTKNFKLEFDQEKLLMKSLALYVDWKSGTNSNEIIERGRKLLAEFEPFQIGTMLQVLQIMIDAGLQSGRLTEVSSWLHDTDSLLQKFGDVNLWHADFLYKRALYYRAVQQPNEAEKTYRELLAYLDKHRGQLPSDDNLLQRERDLSRHYRAFIDFLLERGRLVEALEVLEQAKGQALLRWLQLRVGAVPAPRSGDDSIARFQSLSWQRAALAEQLQHAGPADTKREILGRRLDEVDQAYRDAYQAIAPSLGGSLDDWTLQGSLNTLRQMPGQIVVLDIDPKGGWLATWWIGSGKVISSDSRKIDLDALRRAVQAFSDAISLGDGTVDLEGRRISVAEAGERLAWLLLPRLWELPHGTDLTIIPAPMLEGLPFAALQVRGEPIIATLLDRLNYAPSLRTLEQLQRRIAPAAAGRGLFIGAEAPPPGFSPLVKASEDAVYFVKELTAAGRDGEVLTDGLTEADIRDRVPGHDILQIYLHGMLDPNNPMNSHFILPSGDPISSFDIFRWHLQGAQVLLTACEVGGDVSTEAGDILGMTFPFFVAGARNATHALWRVDQQVASWLMQHIVAAMADGNDASAALVKAQRALIDSDLPLMRKQPRHWAAWRVVGPAP